MKTAVEIVFGVKSKRMTKEREREREERERRQEETAPFAANNINRYNRCRAVVTKIWLSFLVKQTAVSIVRVRRFVHWPLRGVLD